MFIEKRWMKTKWLFLISFLLYLLFLILLSTFFGLMYFREGGKVPQTLSFEDAARECKIIMQKIGSPVRRAAGNMKIEDIAMMFSTIKQRSQEERAKTRLEKKFEKNSVLFTGCS